MNFIWMECVKLYTLSHLQCLRKNKSVYAILKHDYQILNLWSFNMFLLPKMSYYKL
jgi:hypothetical protein